MWYVEVLSSKASERGQAEDRKQQAHLPVSDTSAASFISNSSRSHSMEVTLLFSAVVIVAFVVSGECC